MWRFFLLFGNQESLRHYASLWGALVWCELLVRRSMMMASTTKANWIRNRNRFWRVVRRKGHYRPNQGTNHRSDDDHRQGQHNGLVDAGHDRGLSPTVIDFEQPLGAGAAEWFRLLQPVRWKLSDPQIREADGRRDREISDASTLNHPDSKEGYCRNQINEGRHRLHEIQGPIDWCCSRFCFSPSGYRKARRSKRTANSRTRPASRWTSSLPRALGYGWTRDRRQKRWPGWIFSLKQRMPAAPLMQSGWLPEWL